MAWCCGPPATLFDDHTGSGRLRVPHHAGYVDQVSTAHLPLDRPVPEGDKGVRPELLLLLQRSSLLETHGVWHQQANPRKAASIGTDAARLESFCARPAAESGVTGINHMLVLSPLDLTALERLAMPIAVLVRCAPACPIAPSKSQEQESCPYQPDYFSSAGLQIVACNTSAKLLLSVNSQQECLLQLREHSFLHPRLGLVLEDAFSRLLFGESGCAQLPTPPALQQHCSFSTLHFLTCLYKAGEEQPAVLCAMLLYSPKEADGVTKGGRRGSHIQEQSQLLSENSPDILTVYDLQGTILHQNNASIAFLGNHTSFGSSSKWASDTQTSLSALFQLSPGQCEEMMAVLLSSKGFALERPAQWMAEVTVPPAGFLLQTAVSRSTRMASLSKTSQLALEEASTPVSSNAPASVSSNIPPVNHIEEAEIVLKRSINPFPAPTAAFSPRRALSRSRSTSYERPYQCSTMQSSLYEVARPAVLIIPPSVFEPASVYQRSQSVRAMEHPTVLKPALDGAWLEGDLHEAHEASLKPHSSPDLRQPRRPARRQSSTSHAGHGQPGPCHNVVTSPAMPSPLGYPSPRISRLGLLTLPSSEKIESSNSQCGGPRLPVPSPTRTSGQGPSALDDNLVTLSFDKPSACRQSSIGASHQKLHLLSTDGTSFRSPPSASNKLLPCGVQVTRCSLFGDSDNDAIDESEIMLLTPFAIATLNTGSGWELASQDNEPPESDGTDGDSTSLPKSVSRGSLIKSVSRDSRHRGSRLLRSRPVSNSLGFLTEATVLSRETAAEGESGGDGKLARSAACLSEAESPWAVDIKTAGTCGMPCVQSITSVASSLDPPNPLVLHHRVTATCVRDISLGVTHIVLSHVDITEQVERERELRELVFAEEKLLESVFPRHVIEELTQRVLTLKPSRRERHMATSHEQVTILFADLVGFTSMSELMTPEEVMLLLNRLYTALDDLLDIYGVYKVETIGDCYVVAGGLMQKDQDNFQAVRRASSGILPGHATSTMMFAKAMLKEAAKVLHPRTRNPLQMRVGMHTGAVMSGVVGTRMPRFCLFGDAINTASRMESTSQAGCIHISAATHQLLQHTDQWRATGGVQVKGKGLMETYFWVPPAPINWA